MKAGKPKIKVKRRNYTWKGEPVKQTKTYIPPPEKPKSKHAESDRHIALGRPPMPYDEDMASRIIACIACSTKSLRTIVRENPDFPSIDTIFKWLNDNIEFNKRYALAREQQKAAMYDDMLNTMNEQEIGEIRIVRSKGVGANKRVEQEIKRRDMTEHRRLKIDTIKWTLSKLDPQKYGDKLIVDDNRDTLADLLEQFKAKNQKATAEQQRFPDAPDPDVPVPSESQVPQAETEPQQGSTPSNTEPQ